MTQRSTKRKSRRNAKPIATSQNLPNGIPKKPHNKSLILGASGSETENQPMAIYLNEIVSKNTTVSNNIIVLADSNDASKVQNTLEGSNSSFISSGEGNEIPKSYDTLRAKMVDLEKQTYLSSKPSMENKRPEGLIQSFEGNGKSKFQLRFPEVSNNIAQANVSTTKSGDFSNKSYPKFGATAGVNAKSKLLPSINTKKDLSIGNIKKTPKNRDISMSVIKTGRLALQDENNSSQNLKKRLHPSVDKAQSK